MHAAQYGNAAEGEHRIPAGTCQKPRRNSRKNIPHSKAAALQAPHPDVVAILQYLVLLQNHA